MFGEDLILGQGNRTMDNKGRIILPGFTYAEENDNISFLFSENHDYIRIFLTEKILKMIEMMKEKHISTTDIELLKEIKKQSDLIHSLYCETTHVGINGRIMIPKTMRNELKLENNVYICGGVDYSLPCVKVYKNKESMIKINNGRNN